MGLLDDILGNVPTPVRLYYESVLRGKKDPITEGDFSDSELMAMRQLVGTNNAGGTSYDNYKESDQPGIPGLLSPMGRVANSLGQFDYKADPEGITISDNYDFNPVYGEDSMLLKLMQVVKTGGFSALHMLGENVLPEGKGRKVKIRLPTRLPNE